MKIFKGKNQTLGRKRFASESTSRHVEASKLPMILISSCCVLLLAACELVDSKMEDPKACDNAAASSIVLEGSWIISGSGLRSGCREERYNGDFVLGPSKKIIVSSAGTSGDAGVATDSGKAAGKRQFTGGEGTAAGSFMFVGESEGNCVTFTTEEDAQGGKVSYSFKGRAEGTHTVSGTFEGSGPEGCTAAGQFSVTIK